MKAREDPHGPGVAIFVGNLVENLNQNVYEKMLLEKLGIGNKWNSIEVIYYESGCLVLSYTCSEKAEICYEILKVRWRVEKGRWIMAELNFPGH